MTAMINPVCPAVPPVNRPSDTQFINYAQHGKTNLVAQALSSFPGLINVKDTVSDLWYPITSTVWSAMWTTNVLKLYVVNLWHNSPMSSLQFSMSYTWAYCQFIFLRPSFTRSDHLGTNPLYDSESHCWENQRRQICLELFCLKWTFGNIHIWVLSQVYESS